MPAPMMRTSVVGFEEGVLDTCVSTTSLRGSVDSCCVQGLRAGTIPAMRSPWLLGAGCVLLAGCGAAPPTCTVTGLNLSVSTLGEQPAVADHMAPAPGNQVQFYAFPQEQLKGDCAVPAVMASAQATWTVSDSVNVKISSAKDQTNGLATCVGATAAPATVTATLTLDGFTKSAIASLSCK